MVCVTEGKIVNFKGQFGQRLWCENEAYKCCIFYEMVSGLRGINIYVKMAFIRLRR